jgi:Flp pilus assembly protein TadB
MEAPNSKAGLGLVGAGAAACAACCAGPIVGFLAAIGIASVAGVIVFGALGLLVVVAVAGVFWQRRRRRQQRCRPSSGAVPVEVPQVKASR